MKEEGLRTNHIREFKLECIRQVATGQKRPAQICREHNLSESVLLRWNASTRPWRSGLHREADFTDGGSGENDFRAGKICGKLAPENDVLIKGLARYLSTKGMTSSERPEMSILRCRLWGCASCLG